MNSILYEDEIERRKHQDSIQILARELKITDIEVTEVYENVFMTFKNRVTINHYLPIFVAKRVRQLFVTGLVAQSGFISGPLSGGM
jgi:hypothetical protein